MTLKKRTLTLREKVDAKVLGMQARLLVKSKKKWDYTKTVNALLYFALTKTDVQPEELVEILAQLDKMEES